MEKIQKNRILQRICLGFLPASFEKQENPPTPSIDLKRKQEEKNCFQRFILILIWKTLGLWHLVNLKKFSPRPPSLYISLYFFVPPSSSIHTHYFPPICFFVKIQHTRKIILPILSETFFHLKNFLFVKRAKKLQKTPYALFTKLMICRLKLLRKNKNKSEILKKRAYK